MMRIAQLLKKSNGVLAVLCGLLMLSSCVSVKVTEQYEGGGAAARPGATTGTGRPSWTRDVYQKYNKATDIAALGGGSSNEIAEKDAIGKLIAQFGQSIKVDERVAESYSEAVSKGITTTSFNASVENTVVSSSSMDSLVGAEIGDRWDDGKNNFYAVAVMNKAKAISIYTDKIKSNQALIETLINVPAAQRNTLDAFARFQFAATLADINISYGELLKVIGGSMAGLKKGDDYRLEAREITKNVPIGITVNKDRDKRIETAFRDAVTSLGFQSGGANARYVLNVTASANEASFPNNANKFCRIDITANLVDNTTRNVLVPYNFDLREGHATLSEAENRAYNQASNKIKTEYKDALNSYLSQLLPSK